MQCVDFVFSFDQSTYEKNPWDSQENQIID